MAKLKGPHGLEGKLGGLSYYKMRGVEGIVVREPGGPSKYKVQNDPQLHMLRRNNAEFSGRSTAGKWIRKVIHAQLPMADYNISGPLASSLKAVQVLDTESNLGKRTVKLSVNPIVIKGFPLNKKALFDSVVRSPVEFSISRETGSARVQIPALMPAINLFTPDNYAMFQLVVAWGVVPDLYPDGKKDLSHRITAGAVAKDGFFEKIKYLPSHKAYDNIPVEVFRSDWYPIVKGAPAIDKELTLQVFPPDIDFSLVLSIGICYGIMESADYVRQAPYVGSAKILGVG
ncbi:hypothetical protein [Paraflavitalea sp. CAU 1676]|uniref:hypothetical protein n=1 Tax=Paraflavitalea sp. CAU 1676 TaxID=3032598 RepID=UPI0023DA3A99|nr:hypothetical protein [Paraflavitalea sp. CAU 1676]MDF2190329.1 hypothetical protein [Paraflavitalea sp. CAU 1676]